MAISKKISTKTGIMQFDLNSGKFRGIKSESKIEDQNAVIYCRVSLKEQATQGFGLEGQERTCKERCLNQNPPISIDRVFLEPGISGATTNRKEFDSCLRYLEEQNRKYKKITHFIVTEASRISRPDDIAEAFMMEESIKSTGVKIISLDMIGIDETTDEGHLFKTLQYAIAGFERKKIRKRASNGKISRMKSGFRAFNAPPVGYKRKREGPKNYYDIIDNNKGSIIKEGLELFANDVILTQADLWRFRVKKGLRTNAPNAGVLQKTFPEKVLQLHRLFFYAGHIYYPSWGITEPIDANHDGLITLETARTIIEKIQKLHKVRDRKPLKTHKMTNEHPLRGVVACPYCERKFTSWNTAKYRMKNGERIKKLYPYYGCANPNCEKKVYIKKQVIEGGFYDILNGMTMPIEMLNLVKKVFENSWNKNLKNKFKIAELNKKTAQGINKRQKQLENSMLRTKNEMLYEKLENERSTLEGERLKIEEQLEEQTGIEDRLKIMLDKTVRLFNKPQELRKNGSSTMRQLLIKVRFGDHLYYTKEDGLRTTKKAVLYSLITDFNCSSSLVRQARDKARTFNSQDFKQLTEFIQDNSRYIEAIHNRIEYDNKGDCKQNEKCTSTLEPP